MKIKNELPIIGIVILPFIYLAFLWNQLPKTIPIHWNINGEIDRFGDKVGLLLIPILLPLLTYLIFLVIPKIDPKNKLNNMGNKFQSLKLLMTLLMSVLALFIIYSTKEQSLSNPNHVMLLIGVLYIILGNYFKTIKPNYFIGIKTPWTLESEYIWKETHKLGGILWLVGGILVIILSLILNPRLNTIFFLGITAIITIVPIVYSYTLHQSQNKNIS